MRTEMAEDQNRQNVKGMETHKLVIFQFVFLNWYCKDGCFRRLRWVSYVEWIEIKFTNSLYFGIPWKETISEIKIRVGR
jgi:hypothetical protein